jgi:hypothetical protein
MICFDKCLFYHFVVILWETKQFRKNEWFYIDLYVTTSVGMCCMNNIIMIYKWVILWNQYHKIYVCD